MGVLLPAAALRPRARGGPCGVGKAGLVAGCTLGEAAVSWPVPTGVTMPSMGAAPCLCSDAAVAARRNRISAIRLRSPVTALNCRE
eukprot:10178750-Heterocapsa_arctica.AAC.1